MSSRDTLLKLADIAERERTEKAQELADTEPRYLGKQVVARARRHATHVIGTTAAGLLDWEYDPASPGLIALAELNSETFVEARLDHEGTVTEFVLILDCGSCGQESETAITCLADLAAPLRGDGP